MENNSSKNRQCSFLRDVKPEKLVPYLRNFTKKMIKNDGKLTNEENDVIMRF